MANIESSKKDIRRTAKRRIRNSQQMSRLRTYAKSINNLLISGKVEEAKAAFRVYSSYLDRAGRKNLIHHSQADRRKSRIASRLNKASKTGTAT